MNETRKSALPKKATLKSATVYNATSDSDKSADQAQKTDEIAGAKGDKRADVRKIRRKKTSVATQLTSSAARAALKDVAPERSALACARRMKGSPRKLASVVSGLRGMPVARALALLQFSKKRLAHEAHKVLLSAIANAEHNQGLNTDALHVAEASVGRALVMRRLDIKGRSRSGRIEKPWSHLRFCVAEIG